MGKARMRIHKNRIEGALRLPLNNYITTMKLDNDILEVVVEGPDVPDHDGFVSVVTELNSAFVKHYLKTSTSYHE